MRELLVFSLLLFPFFHPQVASAHAFGKLYNLPVPFWLYLYGGAAALIASFLLIGYFFDKTQKAISYPTRSLPSLRFFTNGWVRRVLMISSMFFFLLTILSGIIGTDLSLFNFNMTFFWILFALGLTYLIACIGNAWEVLNPWKILVELFEKFVGIEVSGIQKYPKSIGYIPALVGYFLFIWTELIGQTTPHSLSLLLIAYTITNGIGVFVIGKKGWFHYGEFFSVFFHLIGKVAFIEKRNGTFYLRPPFIGLLKEKAEQISLLVFILFMLSSTAYDGIRETLPFKLFWLHFADKIPHLPFQTLGLLLSPLIFLFMYLTAITLTKIITASKLSIRDLSLQFAFTLVPIALVYNIAHYYTLLLTQGQEIIRLISDPFGFNWNLFGTANYLSNIGIVNAEFVWHSQVFIILIGHIAGVYLAHLVALRIFPNHRKALLSQIPMLVVMIGYTMIGLWILSQPITSGF